MSAGDFSRLAAVAIATIGLLELTKLIWQPKQSQPVEPPYSPCDRHTSNPEG
jgi:hypothetical protein